MLDHALSRSARFGIAVGAVALATPALAAPQAQMAIAGDWLTESQPLIPAPLVPAAGPCPISNGPAMAPTPALFTKSASILGKPSALEAMRAQQGGASLVGPAPESRSLQPAAGRFDASSRDCGSNFDFAASTRPTSQVAAYRPGAFRPGISKATGDFLESRRVPIKHTFFDNQWDRVSKERPQLGRMAGRIEALAPTRAAKLSAVNLWVNRRISYVEDRALFGRADYWAGARKTLALGKGDCEDYALLKMHLLAEMGIAREDMVLTIARDLVKRQDHAVLLVKDGKGGYVMLDNASDVVLDASRSYDYRPVLSFSANRAWIHGY